MIDSRCGLLCSSCDFKVPCDCGGCIETMGKPFHGECPIAMCCQAKGHRHCGECDELPCDQLYAYSYLDPDHGDKPPGARIAKCREWAAESGIRRWENVLLTSAGFFDADGNPRRALIERFAAMLGKPFGKARVLFVPTASMMPGHEDAAYADLCKTDLLMLGILHENIVSHDADGSLAEGEASRFDAMFFTGGNTPYLAKRVRETGFAGVIKRFVYSNKAYVGVSAGSMLAMADFNVDGLPSDDPMGFAGLCLINARFSVHCDPDAPPRESSPYPHIALTDDQAIVASWSGCEVIGGR